MRKLFRVVVWGLVAGGVALAADWLPDALAELEFFRARDYRVAGARLLQEQQVLAVAAISPFVSVFDDLTSIEMRLEKHPLIRRARVTTELPRTLVVTIEERTPVGFVAGPVLEPVDRDGQVLPLDPVEHRLDLPVLIREGGGAALSPSQLRILAMEVWSSSTPLAFGAASTSARVFSAVAAPSRPASCFFSSFASVWAPR